MTKNAHRLTQTGWDAQATGKVGRAARESWGGRVSRAVPFTPEEIEELRQAGDDYLYYI